MKKGLMLLVLAMISVAAFAAGSQEGFDTKKDIVVISREDGSGTRGAFIELFKIEQKNSDGTKKDLTTKEAIIAKQTDVMMTNTATDKYSIGYISLGSLNDTVKAVAIEGVAATSENVANGAYPVYRPFIIATKGEQNEVVKDFIAFILSDKGQDIASKSYIAIGSGNAYSSNKASGKIVIAGSSSVSPLMEKLMEAYKELNPNAELELQTNDSSSGLKAVIDGIADIGMASRSLKDAEDAEVDGQVIANDGIAIIVNKENPISNLSTDDVNKIFTGEITKWSSL